MVYFGYFSGYCAQAVFSFISVVFCTALIIIILSYKSKLYDNYETKLVFFLLVFYDMLCIVSLFPVFITEDPKKLDEDDCNFNYKDFNSTTDLCKAQGILIQFFSLSGIIWTGFINLVNYREIILNKNKPLPIVLLLGITLVIALVTALVPNFASDSYHVGNNWCWIEKDNTHVNSFYRYGFFYAIAWAIIVFILYVSIRILITYKRTGVEARKYTKTAYIPIILFFCFIPLTIARILQEVDNVERKNCSFRGYLIFASCVMRSLGFFNSIVYGWKSDIRSYIRCLKQEEDKSRYTPAETAQIA